MIRWTVPAASFLTSTRPVPSVDSSTIALLARVWLAPKLMVVAVGIAVPVVKSLRSPAAAACVTVIFTETDFAADGTVHGPFVRTKERCPPAASWGASAGRRVSIRRQGGTGTKPNGPAQPVLIGIVTVPLDVQLELTWTMSSFTEPEGPAEKTRFGVP